MLCSILNISTIHWFSLRPNKCLDAGPPRLDMHTQLHQLAYVRPTNNGSHTALTICVVPYPFSAKGWKCSTSYIHNANTNEIDQKICTCHIEKPCVCKYTKINIMSRTVWFVNDALLCIPLLVMGCCEGFCVCSCRLSSMS